MTRALLTRRREVGLDRPPPRVAQVTPRADAYDPASLLALQRTAGNTAVSALLQRCPDCHGTCGEKAPPAAPAALAENPAAELPSPAEFASKLEAATSLAALQELSRRVEPARRALARRAVGRRALMRQTEGESPATGGSEAGEPASEEDRTRSRQPGQFCQPYAWWEYPTAIQERLELLATLPATATATFGSSEVGAIWGAFLLGGTPTRRSYLSPSSSIVQGFATAEVSVQAHQAVVDQAIDRLRSMSPSAPPNREIEMPIGELLPSTDLDINWSNPFDIPGHIAGGQSGGAGGADTRQVRGSIFVTREVDGQGNTTDVVVRTDLSFFVNDTVDFCPGGAGAGFEQVLTIPLSRLEATGPAWAADVPFDVTYKPEPITRRLGPDALGGGEAGGRGRERDRKPPERPRSRRE